jgi:hypothetical protein
MLSVLLPLLGNKVLTCRQDNQPPGTFLSGLSTLCLTPRFGTGVLRSVVYGTQKTCQIYIGNSLRLSLPKSNILVESQPFQTPRCNLDKAN